MIDLTNLSMLLGAMFVFRGRVINTLLVENTYLFEISPSYPILYCRCRDTQNYINTIIIIIMNN